MTKTSKVLAAYLSQTMMAEVAEAPAQTLPEGSKEVNYTFRTEKVRNEAGEVIGDGTKRPSFKAILPVPTREQLVDFIAAGGKEAEFIDDVIYEAIKNAGRAQINEFLENAPKDAQVTADVLDLSKLTFTAIANTAPESRAKPEIPEEVYNTFFEDYKHVQTEQGKEPTRIQKHIALFKAQFKTCKTDKPALEFLRDNLNLWAAKTTAMEDNKDVFELLMGKVNKYLNADEKNLLGAL